MSIIIDISDMISDPNKCCPDLKEVLSFYNLNIKKRFEDMIKSLNDINKSFSDNINKSLSICSKSMWFFLIKNYMAFGDVLWCVWNTVEDEPLFSHYNLNNGSLPSTLKEIYESGDIEDIEEADKIIFSFMQKEEVESIQKYIQTNLVEKDKIKFRHAITNFENDRFYECAQILCGLIDSQNIKRNLDKRKENDEYPINQGGSAFSVVLIRELLKDIYEEYNQEEYKQVNDCLWKHRKYLEEHLGETKDAKDLKNTLIIINLCCGMNSFFNNYKWTNYPDDKPKIINRNWLMHGMYDYDEIKSTDCIKLMLLLRQIISLYNSLDT